MNVEVLFFYDDETVEWEFDISLLSLNGEEIYKKILIITY